MTGDLLGIDNSFLPISPNYDNVSHYNSRVDSGTTNYAAYNMNQNNSVGSYHFSLDNHLTV